MGVYDNTWENLKEFHRHQDRTLNVRFYWDTEPDGVATVREGREIERPVEMCEIRAPADRQTTHIHRAHQEWKKVGNEIVTYAMRFEDQYRRFRASEQQVVSGTPIASAGWLDGAQKAMLKALDIHTVEQLAALSGQPLKNLGPGGLAMQQAAEEFIRTSKDGAEVTNLVKENAQLKEAMAGMAAQGADPRLKFVELNDDRLKEWIKDKTGEAPRGNPSRSTLVRMAIEAERTDIPVRPVADEVKAA